MGSVSLTFDVSSGVNYSDLFINQGSDWSVAMNFNNADGTPVNIANYVFFGSFKTSYYTSNTTGNFIIQITNATNGNTTVTLNAATTSNIRAGRYFYDLTMMDASNLTTRILEGILYMRPGISNITPPANGLPAQAGVLAGTPWMPNSNSFIDTPPQG